MTTAAEDDFREFVAARWPDLEGVALIVTQDAAVARRVTSRALADLHGRWRDALDDGRPGEAARRAVLRAAVDATPGPDGSGSAAALFDAGPGVDGDDVVVHALVAAIGAEPPVERALVGAATVWGADADVVADLLGMPSAPLRDRAGALRARLTDVHASARQSQGLGPAPWAFDADVDDAVGRLLRGQDDPPDPTDLVALQRRSVRRRAVLTGGAAALAAAGAGAWLLSAGATDLEGGGTGTAPTPSPTDPSWGRTSTWAARGSLARNVDVQAFVISQTSVGSRLLWADDVGDRRLIVTSTVESLEQEGTNLRVFHGPRGAGPQSLRPLELQYPWVEGVDDVVALTLPHGDGRDSSASVVVVLARPTVASALVSRFVRPTPVGTVERGWSRFPLVDGVGAQVVDGPVAPATRIRVGSFDGPPATTAPFWLEVSSTDVTPADLTRAVHQHVEAATGIPADRLATDLVADKALGVSLLDPATPAMAEGDTRVVALRTRTPDGAVLSTLIVSEDTGGAQSQHAIRAALPIPADRAADPVVERVVDQREGVAQFLVVAPDAERVQLIGTAPSGYPVSKVESTGGAPVTVVPVVNGDQAVLLRVVATDSAGAVLHDVVPAVPVDLLDLWA